MATFQTEHLRNVALLGHSGSGKTMLAEAMLHEAGVTTRLGSIEDGSTVSDYEPEEQRRQSSIQTSILTCPWREHKVNIIDTPGYADFRGEAIAGTWVADAAIVVVAGQAGVEVGTKQMWGMADYHRMVRFIFISKMDRENADFERAMSSINEAFGRNCVPIQVPIGAESSFQGSINLTDPDADVPAGMEDAVEEAQGSDSQRLSPSPTTTWLRNTWRGSRSPRKISPGGSRPVCSPGRSSPSLSAHLPRRPARGTCSTQ